jgi:ankyrin repeat protein
MASVAALFSAVRDDKIEFCTPIVRQGISVNSKDNLGNTPLHVAAEANSVNVTRVLLEQHAINLEARNMVWISLRPPNFIFHF